MNPEPGTVQVLGLYEGPTESWEPRADVLADALRRAGAPGNLLQAVITGGRASLEPDPAFFPRGQFNGEPHEVLALALEMLLEEEVGGQPQEWFSSLRVVEYREDKRLETLIQVQADGVRGVVREQPWTPVPPPTAWETFRAQKWILLLIAVGLVAGGWLQRDRVFDLWDDLTGTVFAEDLALAEDFNPDFEAFALFLDLEIELSEDGGLLLVRLERLATYPDSPQALDDARAQASMEEAAALAAIERGRAELRLRFDDGELVKHEVPLDAWQADGRYAMEFPTAGHTGQVLLSARLRP
jgi:hypothetical protein